MTPVAPYFCLGISHHRAPVKVRERLALTSAEMRALLGLAFHESGLTGLVALSTCNRVEFYASVPENRVDDGVKTLERMLGERIKGLEPHLYRLNGLAAAQHLARVAAGLDALVLGEAQILGQIDAAWRLAQENHASSPALDDLFRSALKAGRRARAETDIATNPVSVSSVAVRKAEQALGTLEGKRAAVVGLGETGRLVIKVLRRKRTEDLLFVNRTLSIAQEQAEREQGRALDFMELPEVLRQADVVFCCTGCPYPLVKRALVDRAMASRPDRPLVLVDLAVPHDIEPEVSEIAGVQRLDVDAMQVEISGSLEKRQTAIPAVENILEDELARYERFLLEARVQPLITDLRRQADDIRRTELERLADRLPDLPDDVLQHIERFSQALVQKLYHHPTTGLRREAGQGEAEELARTVRALFQLRERAG
ncbi:MAG: glutamyl-tRNA reductase [Rhodothermales bacterium]|nr:glutamyl-tRNA reductase [Rhodothermales bacterium]MBO6778711.1 glutamyl-tRNA reductase [Rhodothermales bacterium]